MLGDVTVLLVAVGSVGTGGFDGVDDRFDLVPIEDLEEDDREEDPDLAVVGEGSVAAAVERLAAPVVAATDDPAAALDAGADEVVPPDAPVELLERRVRSVLERRPLREGERVVEGKDAETGADGGASVAPPTRRLRTIVDNLPIVLFALDDEGTFTLSEGRGLANLGLEPDEVVGESVRDVYGDNEDIMSAVDRALDGEHVNQVVEVGDLAFEAWYQPVVEDGDVRNVLGAAIDVTDQVERERELEQYETIVETVPDGVFVIDEEGTIVGGNDTAAEMFGYEASELEDESFFTLVEDGVVEETLVDRYVDIVRELLSSDSDDEKAKFEYEVNLPDRGVRHLESHVSLRPFDAEFRGTIGINRDVTERKERERQLRRQNERLDEFASVVSHDLRNPLNVARGTVDLLAEDVDAEGLETVRDSLERMDELIENLLALAHEGQSVTEPAPVALGVVVGDAWSSVAADDAGLVVETDATVLADRSRLRQLLENLLGNSVDHGGTGVRIEVGALDDSNEFYVADDGPGVPEDEGADLFEYGYTTRSNGTGFGLAIVRSIAEAHGWDIHVTESDAGGARFEFTGVEFAD